jgi:hypothetical protein
MDGRIGAWVGSAWFSKFFANLGGCEMAVDVILIEHRLCSIHCSSKPVLLPCAAVSARYTHLSADDTADSMSKLPDVTR